MTVFEYDGKLYNYDTGEYVREATEEETRMSDEAGHTGAFEIEIPGGE